MATCVRKLFNDVSGVRPNTLCGERKGGGEGKGIRCQPVWERIMLYFLAANRARNGVLLSLR